MICVLDTKTDGSRRLFLNLCILLAAAFIGCAKPAQAENTFLLQLGTFDSEDQATQKWTEVKAANADVVGSLSLHIAEVTLPPHHTTSYRAQVGPVSSRGQATSLCNSLQKRSVECYVVETVMFASSSYIHPAASDEADAPEHKPTVVAQDDISHADDPDYIPPPVDSGPVIISSTGGPAASPSPAEVAEMPMNAPAPTAEAAAPSHVSIEQAQAEESAPAPSTVSKDRYVPGRGPRFLDAPEEETTVAAAAPVPAAPAPAAEPAAAPAPTAEEAPKHRGFFSRLFGSSPTPPANTEGVVGNVTVAEAVRVPLSSENEPPRQKIVPVLPEVHAIEGAPDDSTAKTFWAQISYFRDESQALTFYRNFSTNYPQYTEGVRIRITRPFASGASGKVSLRVGPFAGTDDVHTICAAATRWSARCTVVRDLGASTDISEPPHKNRTAKADHGKTSETAGTYWAQLGTFHSQQEAWDAWQELKDTHKNLVRHIKPSVTTPPKSTATTTLFRLRAGPFVTADSASSLCGRLQDAGQDCVLVNDR